MQRAPRNRPEECFVLRFLHPTVGIGEVFFLWRLTKDEDPEAEKLIELCGARVVVSTERDSLQRGFYQSSSRFAGCKCSQGRPTSPVLDKRGPDIARSSHVELRVQGH